jgi:hypothetical protein
MPRHYPLRSTSREIACVRTPLTDALVGPAGVVAVAVLLEDALKMVDPEDEEMVETLPSH